MRRGGDGGRAGRGRNFTCQGTDEGARRLIGSAAALTNLM